MPNLLKELSKSNDGFYMKGDNTEAVVDEIISKLKQMDSNTFALAENRVHLDHLMYAHHLDLDILQFNNMLLMLVFHKN